MKFIYNNVTYKLIILTLSGSRFYGTHYELGEHPFKPDYCSDSDFRGVFIAHPDTKIGLIDGIKEIEIKKDKDGLVSEEGKKLIDQLNEKLGLQMDYDTDLLLYEAKKFVTLALENNPNVLDILYADKKSIIYSNKKGEKLLSKRDIFISKKTKFTFSGYAISQLNRIRGTSVYNVHTLSILNQAFDAGDIDDEWIKTNFKGLHSAKIKMELKKLLDNEI